MFDRMIHSWSMPAVWLAVFVGLAAPARGGSLILEPIAGLQADDYYATDGTDARMITSFDVLGSQVAVWGSNFAEILDRNTGSVLASLDRPVAYFSSLPGGVSVYNSFTAFDPSGESVWVGFTTTGNTDDRIFEVTYSGGAWTWNQRATLTGNFELAFSGGQAYISANPGGMGSANGTIYKFDASGANQHDVVAEVGGYAAGLAFDAAGDLYYGTNFLSGSSNELIKYTAAQVAGAIGSTPLAFGDAAKLADLEYGAYDVEVDSLGRVLFTMDYWDWGTGATTTSVEQWNGSTGSGQNYTELAHGIGAWGTYLTFLHASGDFAAGGRLYVADGFQSYNGVAGISGNSAPGVPEPATIGLALAAALGLALGPWRRRRRSPCS